MNSAWTAELSGYGDHRNIDQRSRDGPFIFASTDSEYVKETVTAPRSTTRKRTSLGFMKGAVSFEVEFEVVLASALPCNRAREISHLL